MYSKNKRTNKEIFKAVLFAIAFGDAFGMSTELMARSEIKEKLGFVDKFLDSQKSQYFDRDFKAGTITDDTIQTILLIESIYENKGKINTEAYLKSLFQWSKSDEEAGQVIGPSTKKALDAYEKGESIEKLGIGGTTNGSVMKIAPIGLLNINDSLEDLIKDVYAICLPTHNSKIAIQGAAVIANIIRSFLTQKADWSTIWGVIEDTVEQTSNLAYDLSQASLKNRIWLAKSIVNQNLSLDKTLDLLSAEIGSSMETIETVPAAIALAYLAQDNIKNCAIYATNLGGDTDTIASIACAITASFNPDINYEDLEFIEKTNKIDIGELADKMVESVHLRKNSNIHVKKI